MKTLLFILTLLFPLSVYADGQISKEKIDSHGKQRSYYLYVPESAKTSTSPSLVVLLHGTGRNGLSLVEKWKDLADQEGFIIAGPDASGDGWRTPEDGPEFLHDLIELLIGKFSIDQKRIYLFGHSGGAVFALGMAMYESEYFAAVAVHAGSWRSKEEFGFIDLAKRKTPIKIIVGDRDGFFPLDSVNATQSALKKRQFPIEVTIMKGHDHWYYDLAPEINKNAWDFLKQNALPGERSYAEYSSEAAAADVNVFLKQINSLRLAAEKYNIQVYAKEEELRLKDRVKEKVAITEIARAQIEVLIECGKLLRDAAEASERGAKTKTTARYTNYFSLMGQACLKRAEALDLIRARTELLLTDDDLNVINMKRSEFALKANVLNEEALALETKASKVLKS